MRNYKKYIREVLIFGVALFLSYQGFMYYQSYLGHQSADSINIQSHTLSEAQDLSEAEGKFIFAKFSAVWCGACRSFNDNVLKDQRVEKEISEKLVYVPLEYDDKDHRTLFERYGVNRFPTVLILNSKGDVVKELPVSYEAESFLGRIQNLSL